MLLINLGSTNKTLNSRRERKKERKKEEREKRERERNVVLFYMSNEFCSL